MARTAPLTSWKTGARIGVHGWISTPPSMEHDMDDPYDLQRFVDAQDPVYAQVSDELRHGRKRSHWMWFVFPQIQGLGASAMAQQFALSSLAEAEAYLRHPILGPRLRESTQLVNLVKERSIEEIFGYPDYLKFRSSISLFARATSDNDVFVEALRKYFDGEPDPRTLQLL
ncbi:conserved hypothetical protein [Paraburkholderia ribeironis]|uniref:Calpastatin n=2 Tax=Paraburkholderia ribeironis TaxID=1247936 RepID=A0A1N7RM35_9BURK|nr:conserved hypothetical protein [Paraburkholderia ribeironis]